jgi:hypothetical protein
VFIKGKKKREELRLPILHYVVADDWIEKLGEKAFSGWLRFHTWCDRTEEARGKSDYDIIPYSLEKVAEKLGCSVSTLYRSYIHPLWEYGLIDLQEYSDSVRKTTKPVNIIVYDYPQNQKELETKPLEKCRDWKKDYGSKAQFFALKLHKTNPSKNERVDPSKNERVHPSKNERVTLSKIEGNNVLNISNNVSNNSITNESNSLLMDEEKTPVKETKLFKHLLGCKIDSAVAKAIVELSIHNELQLNEYEIKEQLKQMYYETNVEGKVIVDYPTYFLNGIVIQRQQRKERKQRKDLEKIQDEKFNRQLTKHQETVPFYNWLE